MDKLKSYSLYHTAWIMGSDVDQPIIMEIYAGFDACDNLIICLDHIDYEDRRYDCSTWICVGKNDAETLAEKLDTDYLSLPYFIGVSMEDWGRIVNADFNEVKACFQEIYECLLDEGCRLRIERSYGKHGYMCY